MDELRDVAIPFGRRIRRHMAGSLLPARERLFAERTKGKVLDTVNLLTRALTEAKQKRILAHALRTGTLR